MRHLGCMCSQHIKWRRGKPSWGGAAHFCSCLKLSRKSHVRHTDQLYCNLTCCSSLYVLLGKLCFFLSCIQVLHTVHRIQGSHLQKVVMFWATWPANAVCYQSSVCCQYTDTFPARLLADAACHKVLGNMSITTDQKGGVTPVIDQLFGVRNQSLAFEKRREPATTLLGNYSQAGQVALPLAWGSPFGTTFCFN